MPPPPTGERESHLGRGERRDGEGKSEIPLLVGRLWCVSSFQQHDMTQHVILSVTLSVH